MPKPLVCAFLLVFIAAHAAAQPFPTTRGPRQWPKAEWLDPNQQAPNGTQYKTFNSKTAGGDVSYLIYLPPGYEQQPAKRYPVIYWLHGMGGNQRAGALSFVPLVEAAIKERILPPVVVVCVNGMVKGFYCDSADGKTPIESVIIKDLVPHIDQTYRTIARREARMIEGYSMGGYGAGHLGFKYPELFGSVMVDAGALLDPAPNQDLPSSGPMFGVFGNNRERRIAEHPRTLAGANADQLRGKTHIRVGCGSLDDLLPRNQDLHQVLTELKIDHDWIIVPDIAHAAPLYYKKLGTKGFEFHAKALAGVSE